jgi:hypothetical protein
MVSVVDPEIRLFHKFISLIKDPVTEMVLAAIIDLSRNYIFSFIHQYIGDPLIYTIIQYLIVLIPWIMLGHGALRYPQKTNVKSLDINYDDSSTLPKPKTNLNLLILFFSISFIIKFISL